VVRTGPAPREYGHEEGERVTCRSFFGDVAVGRDYRAASTVTRWSGPFRADRDARVELELLNERRFANGVVFLRYRSET